MNEELLNEALTSVFESVVTSKEFVLEQAPEVIHQLLLYTAISKSVLVVLGLFCIFISYKAVFVWSNQEPTSCGQWSGNKCIAVMLGGFTSVLSSVMVITQGMVLLKALIAPKLYLLEYASRLVN